MYEFLDHRKVAPIADADMNAQLESGSDLVSWPGDDSLKVDRFDARLLLTAIPDNPSSGDLDSTIDLDASTTIDNGSDDISQAPDADPSVVEPDIKDLDLLFYERYRDLIDHQRLQHDEEECIRDIDDEWNVSLLNSHRKDKSEGQNRGVVIAHRYEVNQIDHPSLKQNKSQSHDAKRSDSESDPEVEPEPDPLESIEDLNDIVAGMDSALSERVTALGRQYGIKNLARTLRRKHASGSDNINNHRDALAAAIVDDADASDSDTSQKPESFEFEIVIPSGEPDGHDVSYQDDNTSAQATVDMPQFKSSVPATALATLRSTFEQDENTVKSVSPVVSHDADNKNTAFPGFKKRSKAVAGISDDGAAKKRSYRQRSE